MVRMAIRRCPSPVRCAGGGRAGDVVKSSRPAARRAPGLVEDDQRPVARPGGLDGGRALGQRLDHPGVHRRVADPRHVAVRAARPAVGRVQQEAEAVLLQGAGEAVEQQDGGGVGERVGEPLVDQHADRADATAAQTARHRVGSGEPELRGAGEDPLPQRRRELVGPVVGVGHRGGRDAEVASECDEGQPASGRHVARIVRHASSVRPTVVSVSIKNLPGRTDDGRPHTP